MVKTITFTVSTYKTLTGAGKARLVMAVTGVKDENGTELPAEYRNVFLYSKPASETGEVSVQLCSRLSPAPVERFNELDLKQYGTVHPASWDELPAAAPVLTPELDIEDAVIASDIDLGPFAADRYFVSSVLVVEGSHPTVATVQEYVTGMLEALKASYAVYMNDFSTVTDTDLYPTGWEVYEL